LAQILSIKDMSKEFKIFLVKELGFNSDGTYVQDEKGEKILDRYTNEPVKLDNMAILPGSTIVLDNNPLSIASYLEEFGDVI